MSSRASRSGALTITLTLVLAVNGQSSTGAVTAAQVLVDSPSTSLLDAETLQFNDAVFERIANHNATSEFADFFSFESDGKLAKRQSSLCKTYPGDLLWPSKLVWDIFDLLLGRRLLATEPIASSCYDSTWGDKNLTECNALVGRFTKATTQCVYGLLAN